MLVNLVIVSADCARSVYVVHCSGMLIMMLQTIVICVIILKSAMNTVVCVLNCRIRTCIYTRESLNSQIIKCKEFVLLAENFVDFLL